LEVALVLLMFRLTFFAVAALLVATPAFAAISESRASSTISRTREASQLSDPALPSALGAVMREALLEERYDAVWQAGTPLPDVAGAWQAPNRAQGYRTFFTERGLHVRPRTAAHGDWDWSLFLTHWGRAGNTTAVRATEPTVEGTRIRYARGGLEEWYVNTDAGLEQGFTLSRPPQASATDGPIVLDFEQSGRLQASAAAPTTLALVDGAGTRRLRFGELLAYDADGRALDARFVVRDAGLRIEVDDRGARYPVTIDPILTNEEAKLVASLSDSMAIAWFGAAVAIDGATAIVGAPTMASPTSFPEPGPTGTSRPDSPRPTPEPLTTSVPVSRSRGIGLRSLRRMGAGCMSSRARTAAGARTRSWPDWPSMRATSRSTARRS
jgi:hypothetical protein